MAKNIINITNENTLKLSLIKAVLMKKKRPAANNDDLVNESISLLHELITKIDKDTHRQLMGTEKIF